MAPAVRLLFTGYAHVHFACFRPLYKALLADPRVEILVSGGLRSRVHEDDAYSYDAGAMYRPFGLSNASVLTVEEIRRREFDVLFSASTKPIAPAAHHRAIQIFHGLSFRNRSVRSRNLDYDHCFAIGPCMMRRFGALGAGTDGGQLVPVGFPKTDRLCDGSLDRAAIRRSLRFDGSRPVLLYAPTGAHDNSLETIGEALLTRLGGQDRYDVIVKPHDHPKKQIDWFARLAPLEVRTCVSPARPTSSRSWWRRTCASATLRRSPPSTRSWSARSSSSTSPSCSRRPPPPTTGST